MSGNYEYLLHHCVEAVRDFRPVDYAADTYIGDYLEENAVVEDEDLTFVTEVFAGVFRYNKIISSILDIFYSQDENYALLTDRPLYEVLYYLALFRLDEIGMDNYRQLILCNDTHKMYRLTKFIFNHKNLITWMKCEWCKHYDELFVKEQVLEPILRHLSNLKLIISELQRIIDNTVTYKRQEFPTTDVKPFNLTKVKPRAVPMPEIIPQLPGPKPIPESVYKEPSEFEKISRQRVQNRLKAEKTLVAAASDMTRCANPEKSEKSKKILQKIQDEQEAKLNFEGFRAAECRQISGTKAMTKLNTTAILREGNLYEKQNQKTIQKIREMEAGAYDSSRLLRWQDEAKQRELQEHAASLERKHLTGRMCYEDAILAKQATIEGNKTKVQEMKEEEKRLMKEYLDQRLKDEKTMKQLVQDTHNSHKNARDSKKKLRQYKQKLVQEMNEESRELMKQALEEAEAEMQRRIKIINEIRSMEHNLTNREKLVDLATPAGYGFLDEMSIVELKERLALMRVELQKQEESKRDEIIADKSNKNQNLLDTLGMITKHRDEMNRLAAQRLEEKKKLKLECSKKSGLAQEMEKELEEKRARRKESQAKNVVQPSKSSPSRWAAYSAEKKTLEESRWRELERRQKRIAKLTSQGVSEQTPRFTMATVS